VLYIGLAHPQTPHFIILYIFSTNISTEFSKYAAYSLCFSLQNAVYFKVLPFLVPFIIRISHIGCAKI
jgi:hypothetical protein